MTEQEFKQRFKELMRKEELQLPRRQDGSFAQSLTRLLDFYLEQLDFVSEKKRSEIGEICNNIKAMAVSRHMDDCYRIMEYMLKETAILSHFHIITQHLPVDGYGVKNANLFRVRECDADVTYHREDVFHLPMNMSQHTRAYRYNIPGYPSLYLASTVYACCKELGKSENDRLIGSMYRLNRNIKEHELFIIDLGVRPLDFHKSISNKVNYDRMKYSYSNYLYVYPLIAACSFIAARKQDAYLPEYSISNALFRWLHHTKQDVVCGIRYFSCISPEYKISDGTVIKKESNSSVSFTKYFINYAFAVEKDLPEDAYYSHKLKQAFLLTKPRHITDSIDIKDFEKTLKQDVASLKHIL